jgi:hypothetical protein
MPAAKDSKTNVDMLIFFLLVSGFITSVAVDITV